MSSSSSWNYSVLWDAALADNAYEVRKYIANDGDLNADYHMGKTVLHVAAVASSRDVIQLLLGDPNIDLMKMDVSGHTALDLARKYADEEIVGLIENEIRRRVSDKSLKKKTRAPTHSL